MMFHVIKLSPCGETYHVVTSGFNILQALLTDLNKNQPNFGSTTAYVANLSGPQREGLITATSMRPLTLDPDNKVFVLGREEGEKPLTLVAN